MKHKYLDDAGISYKDTLPKKDHRRPSWAQARKTWGFDERETWCLKETFLKWLYEHIKMYIDVNDCDMTYHKFEYKGKKCTQIDILNWILEDIELYFNAKGSFIKEFGNNPVEWWDKQPEYLREIGELWGLVLPAMWW